MGYRILTINPGSTSTKIGVFENNRLILEETIRHSDEELRPFYKIVEQYYFRKAIILETLDKEGINLSKLDAVCGRGGLLRPIQGGTYKIDEMMLEDLRNGYSGEHASNLGGVLAYEIATGLNIPSFIVDPVVVDELQRVARISGVADIERKSIFHALNQKSVARKVAEERGKKYEEVSYVVAHMGGGITVGAHYNGTVIDVNDGLHGSGPFSPERAGTVPTGDLIEMCFSGEYYRDEVMKKIVGAGGLIEHLGTSDGRKVEEMISSGDEKARIVYEAMAYNIGKEIGMMSVVLKGKVDAIILTGGLAYSDMLMRMITESVDWIADVIIYPGENELQALAEGALRVLNGTEVAKKYIEGLVTIDEDEVFFDGKRI